MVVVSSGKVVAAGRSAARHGIEVGITAERARTLFPEVCIRVRDAHLEEAAWEEVLQSLNGVTPFMEHDGPPFAFFVSDDEQAVRHLTNTLPAQTGVAPARSIARLAALRAATGNTLVISGKRVERFLERFEVDRLAEIDFDEEMTELLRHFGYGTLGAVSSLSLRHLKAQFGGDGERLFRMLHPEDEPRVPLYREPRVIRVTYDFDDACREPRDLLPVLEHLVERAVRALRSEHCQRLRLSLKSCRSKVDALVCRILPEPVGNARPIMRAAGHLLGKALPEVAEVDRLELELGALRHVRSAQLPLFRSRPSVYTAVRAVHRRFPGAVCRAVVQPHVLFSEDEMRFDPYPEAATAGRGRRPG